MQRRTADLVAFVAFAVVTSAGWVIAYFLTIVCVDGHDMEGRFVGGCSSQLGPVGYIIPILVGGIVAVFIQRGAR
jgi:hypothetical protein